MVAPFGWERLLRIRYAVQIKRIAADAKPFTIDLLSAEISPIRRLSNQPEAYRMQGPFKALQQIAFGHVVLPSGKTRRMYNYEIINLAREACDHLGIAYSNGACDPFKPTAKAADKFAGVTGNWRT